MTLEFYSFMNFLSMAYAVAGFILPAVIIYFYSAHKSYVAPVLFALLLVLPALLAGEYITILVPFILSAIFASAMGVYLKKSAEGYWQSIGYMILAEFAGIVIGVVVIFFYYGRQDLTSLLAQGFRNVYETAAPSDQIAKMSIDLLTQLMTLATQGSTADFTAITDMSLTEELDMIVPLIKMGLARALPSFMMAYGILSGVWAWLMSSIMIDRRARAKKPLKGVEEHKPHPPFSEWKLPRWLTNVLMLVLLVSIIISFSTQGPFLNAAYVLQTVAVTVLAIQGLAVVNWWLKKKKVKNSLNILICVVTVMLSMVINFLLPLLGVADIMFSMRMSDEQKELIKKRMEAVKKQMDEQLQEMEDQKKEEDDSFEQNKNQDNKQENDDKSDNKADGEDENGEEK